MKIKKLLAMLCVIAIAGLFTQCEKYGVPMGGGEPDPDSDRPEWAGGNTDLNDHNKKDEGGTSGGSAGEYGDLYVLLRDLDGVPEMLDIPVVDEEGNPTGEIIWVVQPVDVDGEPLELDAEGGLTPESLLLAQPVDFGRLNIVRSPQSVLDQALGEALKVINAGVAFSLDFCGRLTIWNYDESGEVLIITKTIDSPRENMALYQEIMNFGFDGELIKLATWDIDPYVLAASCFAAGSDKTGTVNIDEVVYINGFMDCLGCDPILNEHEYNFDNENLWYFNFGDCDCHSQFQYNRDVYKDRMLNITILYPDGTWEVETVSIWQAMEDRQLFTYRWGLEENKFRVDGFAAAVDDAVQVLEFVHGNTNIEFVAETPVVPVIVE